MERNLLVVNPGSGTQDFRDKLSKIKTAYQNRHLEVFFTSRKHASAQLHSFLTYNQPFDHIIVMGGDGTLNHVINGMPDFEPVLSIISNGTGNDTVKSIHGKTEFPDQLNIALTGSHKLVDIGICNDRYFINGVGLGFDGEVVAQMIKKPAYFNGHWAYKFVVLKSIAFYRAQKLAFSIDDDSIQQPVFSMTVANGAIFGGGFTMNPHAQVNDGQLDVVVINGISIAKRIFLLPRVKFGEHIHDKSITCYKAGQVCIDDATGIKAHIDGEPLQQASYQFKIHHKAIKFKAGPK